MFTSIQQKFATLFLILSVITVAFIGWYSFRITEEAVIDNAMHQMELKLEEQLHEFETFHTMAENVMSIALEHPVFKDYFSLPESRAGMTYNDQGAPVRSATQERLRQQMDQWSNALQRRFPIGESCLIDRAGQEHTRITLGQPAMEVDLSHNESDALFFQESFHLKPGQVYVASPYMSGDVKKWVFAYTSPIVLEDDSIPAFYHFEIPMEYFQNILHHSQQKSSAPPPLNDRLFIVDEHGLVIADGGRPISLDLKSGADPNHETDLAGYLPNVNTIANTASFQSLMSQTNTTTQGRGIFQDGEQTMYMVYKKMPMLHWTLVYLKSYDKLLDGVSSLTTIRQVIITACGIMVVVAFWLAWFFSSLIARPLRQVSQAMVQLEQGHLVHVPSGNDRDELAQMARTFNQMSDEIARSRTSLTEEKNKLTTIILSAREAIVVADNQGHVVLVNPAAERLLEKNATQIVQDGFLNLVDNADYVQTFLHRKGEDMPETLVYKNRYMNFFAATITGECGSNIGSAAFIRDITDEKQLEEKLREMSFSDSLTGLYNRRWLETALANEYSRASRYGMEMSILFFDVDHFKRFNDEHGHEMGDQVLAAIGQAAKKRFRKPDVACRYGGEEFCIILPNTGLAGALIAADRFRIFISQLNVSGLQVTISIGIASHPDHKTRSTEEFMKAADLALYASKHGGRNRVSSFSDIPNDQ